MFGEAIAIIVAIVTIVPGTLAAIFSYKSKRGTEDNHEVVVEYNGFIKDYQDQLEIYQSRLDNYHNLMESHMINENEKFEIFTNKIKNIEEKVIAIKVNFDEHLKSHKENP